MYFPRFSPANDSEYYAACDMGEMFHSADFGKTYSQFNFTQLSTGNISTYEMTSNPNIAYVDFSDNNNGYPVRTLDGGATWTQLAGFDASDAPLYGMAATYYKPAQIILDYYDKITISNDTGNTFTTVATEVSSGAGIVLGGVFTTVTGDSIYIGTNQGVYFSTDGGGTFHLLTTTGIPSGEGIWQFAGAESGGTIRFCIITALNSNLYNGLMPWDYYGLVANVYTMDNVSGNWVKKTGTIDTTNDFVEYVTMARNDVKTIYLGGGDNATGGPLVYKSADGGSTWNKVFVTANNQNIITGWEGAGGDKNWGWDQNCFGITTAPYNSSIVAFGNYGDIQLTSDGGANWRQAYLSRADEHPENALTPTQKYYHSSGLENTSCWQTFWQSPSHMLAGYSDVCGWRSIDSGQSWGFSYNGLSGVNSIYRIAATPSKATLFAATSNTHDIYESTHLTDASLDGADANGNVIYSTDGGANWSTLHAFGHHVFWITLDPNDSNKAYASVINHASGTGGIWMTTDLNSLATSTWTRLPAPARTEGHPASIIVLNDGKVLCSYSSRRNSSGAFTDSSGVFLYDPSTSSWSDVSDPNMHYWTMDVVVDPSDTAQNTWYAGVFTHWGSTASGQGGLYRTTNRGGSWTKLTGTQFDRVTSVTIDPNNDSVAYLTTETQGLNYTTNIKAASPTWSLVTSYPFWHPERVFFNPYNSKEMWVTSFGNGMKVSSNTTKTGFGAIASSVAALTAYPNPVTNMLHISVPDGYTGMVNVYDMNGRLVQAATAAGRQTVSISTTGWVPGEYIVRCGARSVMVVKE
jgi:Secretion system C-terminal sorting domain